MALFGLFKSKQERELDNTMREIHERIFPGGEADFANKVLSAMRHQFGGHLEPPGRK